MLDDSSTKELVVIGAGPAGLTAAHDMTKASVKTTVIEKDNVVGGISRTVSYRGYLFDIGGHRFFTKVDRVDDWWHKMLPNEFLLRSRESRILYSGKYFHYPLRPLNALFGLGVWVSFLVMLSYMKVKLSPKKHTKSFEDWICSRFGRKLYNIFFKTYTEKVWGIPCSSISAEWASQRISGLSLVSAVKNALFGDRAKHRKDVIKTLIGQFHYPKFGPGMMWERTKEVVEANGGEVFMETELVGLNWNDGRITSVEVSDKDGRRKLSGTDFISTMPIRELCQKLNPAPPENVLGAAEGLHYRDFLTVALIVNKEHLFNDNWIYIHDDSVKVGRIQNFKNWSPHMVPDASKTCLGLEYFCFEGDGLWTMSDVELLELGRKEIAKLGIAPEALVEDGSVVRMPKAYPIYDDRYEACLEVVKSFLSGIENLQMVGRNGMHKYNNQDHSMLTAMLAVENILGASHDLWAVNAEQEYHEEITSKEMEGSTTLSNLAQTQPKVPRSIPDI